MDSHNPTTTTLVHDISELISIKETQSSGLIDLVSPETYLLVIKCIVGVRIFVCIGGMSANILNIRTFTRIGLDDSVTVLFFTLALSDLGLLVGGLAYNVCRVLQLPEVSIEIGNSIPFVHIALLCSYFGGIFNTITVVLTAFLSLQRCLCVAMPFHFKGIFTRFNTNIVIIVVSLFSIVFMSTFISRHDIRNVFDPATNTSSYALIFLPGRAEMATFMHLGLGIVLNSTCQGITLISVLVMKYFLTKSLRFRQSTAASAPIKSDEKTIDEGKAVINSKEKQAIVQVVVLSTIFLICNAPFLILSFVVLITPEFQAMFYTFFTIYEFKYLLDYINSAVNFIVYYKYNSKFRANCFVINRKT